MEETQQGAMGGPPRGFPCCPPCAAPLQEVFAADKPRMSISGWYHADSPPLGAERASLRQLQVGVKQSVG